MSASDMEATRGLSGRSLASEKSFSKRSHGPKDLHSLMDALRSSLDPIVEENLKKGGEEGLTEQVCPMHAHEATFRQYLAG